MIIYSLLCSIYVVFSYSIMYSIHIFIHDIASHYWYITWFKSLACCLFENACFFNAIQYFINAIQYFI